MVGYQSAQHRRAALKLECLKASSLAPTEVQGAWGVAPASSGWLVKSRSSATASHGHTVDRTPATTRPPLPHVPLLRHQQNQDRQREAHRGVGTVRVGCQGRGCSHDLPQQTPHTRRPQHRPTLQRPDDGHEVGTHQGQGQAGGGALLRGPARTRRGNKQAGRQRQLAKRPWRPQAVQPNRTKAYSRSPTTASAAPCSRSSSVLRTVPSRAPGGP